MHRKLTIVDQPIDSLKPYPGNARTHSKRQIRQIAESIKFFGFTNPIMVDNQNQIVSGVGRLMGAKLVGMSEVPTTCLDGLSPDQIRAYILADNHLAELAGWDKEILAIELEHLLTIVDFDVTLTGFDVPEIDLIIQEATGQPAAEEEVAIDGGPAVTQVSDIWQLGNHRVICGNSVHETTYVALMGKRRANAIFTDPPFNVRIEGNVCGKGSVHHREFSMASGEMSQVEFISFLVTVLGLLLLFSAPGSVHFICMDWRHMADLLAAGRQVYDELLNLCVWVKNNGGMGSFYRSRHELVFVFRNGKTRHRNNVQLGQYGRNRTNVWEYPCANTFSKNAEEGNLLALHPTVKPVALVADALLDCTSRGDLVLDAFLGSGTTLMAAERIGRVCYGIEIDPAYVDVIIRRWQRYTGGQAIHTESGKSFDELAASQEQLHER